MIMCLSRTTSNLAVAIDCEWGSWTTKGCSSTCGQGTRIKIRTVKVKATQGGKCVGKNTMNEACNLGKCPGKFSTMFLLRYNVFWLEIKFLRSVFSTCSSSETTTPVNNKVSSTTATSNTISTTTIGATTQNTGI